MAVGSMDVDVEECFVILEGVVQELATHGYPCVFDKDVDLFIVFLKVFDYLMRNRVDLGVVGHIQLNNLNLVGERAVTLDSF